MSYLHTKMDSGADLHVYPDLIVVAHVTDKKAYFYCTAGTKSSTYLSMAALKDWLTEEGIDFFHITANKIACKPHVLGRGDNDCLVYNPIFYNQLSQESKKLFIYHSFEKYYYAIMRKGSVNKLLKQKADPKSKANTKAASTIKSMMKGQKNIVSSIKSKPAPKNKKSFKGRKSTI
jgi:hypothetical protein